MRVQNQGFGFRDQGLGECFGGESRGKEQGSSVQDVVGSVGFRLRFHFSFLGLMLGLIV